MKYSIKKDKKKFSEVEILKQKISEIRDLKKSQKETVHALKISEANFQTLFDSSPDAIFVEDNNGNVLNANPKASELHGIPVEKLIGMNAVELVPEELKSRVKKNINYQSNISGDLFESFSSRINGEVVPVEISTNIITYANEPAILLHVRDISERTKAREELKKHRDDLENLVRERTFELHTKNIQLQNEISDRKRLQKQLFQSQKLEAVGRLAGGIAHDFNNILTVISGYSEIIQKNLLKGDKNISKVKQIKLAADKAEALTKQLLAFSRKQVLKAKTVNLNSLFREMEKFLRRLLKENIKIKKTLDKNLKKVLVDPFQIEQVIMNLFINASDAIEESGTITIKTENIILDKSRTFEDVEMKPGEYVSLTISDTGVGMDEKTRLKVFDPFFTTKTSEKGTGLGLSVVYGIVKQSNGFIWVKSKVSKGSSFQVLLPVIESGEIKKEIKKSGEISLEGSEKILVVEDNKPVRTIICEFLSSHGYEVVSASNGREALALPASKIKNVKLVLSDIVMPFMGGPELVKELVRKYPKIKVLFMSGYTDLTTVKRDVLLKYQHYIQKPFSSKVLLSRIREILDSGKKR